MSNLLVRIFGWKATLHHGDPLVWDRWRWISKRLRKTHHVERLLDVGCGSGAFSIGTAKLGYQSLGLSWDKRNQAIAQGRARMTGAQTATFEVCDVRQLDQHTLLVGKFDVVLCTENIEHILDDFRLMRAMAACLKPGGRLLMTSPYIRRLPWSSMDYGPFPDIEDGRHVRRGYSKAMLTEMCAVSGLLVDEVSYLSGPLSQLGAYIMERSQRLHWSIGWLAVLPFRVFPPLVDPWLGPLTGVVPFCIGLEALKPRLDASSSASASHFQSRQAA